MSLPKNCAALCCAVLRSAARSVYAVFAVLPKPRAPRAATSESADARGAARGFAGIGLRYYRSSSHAAVLLMPVALTQRGPVLTPAGFRVHTAVVAAVEHVVDPDTGADGLPTCAES